VTKRSLKNIHRLINFAVDQLPVDQMFVADLKTTIEKLDSKEARKPSQYYKPSSMLCLRNMYFQRVGQPIEDSGVSACLVGICETGSSRHIHIQSYVDRMREIGVDCEYIDVGKYVEENKLEHLQIVGKKGMETKLLHKDLNISFLCDGIIKYHGEYYIFEFKTESTYKWTARSAIADEHIPQGTAYSLCFNIDRVLFVYENRDNCDKKAYLLNVTDDMKFDLIVSKIEECDQFVSKLVVPPKSKETPRKACEYCNYKIACRRAGESGG